MKVSTTKYNYNAIIESVTFVLKKKKKKKKYFKFYFQGKNFILISKEKKS